jgi:hypothetical protein
VKRVRRLVRERYGKASSVVQTMCIDTDSGSLKGESSRETIGAFCDISVSRRDSIQIKKELEKGKRKEMALWVPRPMIPQLDKFLIGVGAGSCRAAGRIALFFHIEKVQKMLRELLTTFRSARKELEAKVSLDSSTRIWIISSSCGGTGAGILMDMIALVQDRFQELGNCEINAVLTMPSVPASYPGIDTKGLRRMRANGFGCLAELQHILEPTDVSANPWRVVYPGGTEVTISAPPLSRCLLIENANDESKVLPPPEIHELVARAIVQEISPFGTYLAARDVDGPARGLLEPDPDTGKQRVFASFGVASVAIPAREILRFVTLRATEKILGGLLADGNMDCKEDARTFLKAARLDEFGLESNDLQDLLGIGWSGGAVSSLGVGDWKLKTEDTKKVEELLKKQEKFELAVDTFCKEKAAPRAKANRDILLGKGVSGTAGGAKAGALETEKLTDKKTEIGRRMLEIFLKSGISAQIVWAEYLRDDFASLAAEMKTESERWGGATWNDDRAALRSKISGFHLGDTPERRLVDRHNEVVEEKLRDVIRAEARTFFEEMSKWMDESVRELRDRKALLEEVVRKSSELGREAELGLKKLDKSGFTYERLLLPTGGLEDYAGAVLPDADAVQAALQEGFAAVSRLKKPSPLDRAKVFWTVLSRTLRWDKAGNLMEKAFEGEGRSGAEELQRRLDILRDSCRPFWSMTAPDGVQYSESLHVASPFSDGTSGQAMSAWMQKNVPGEALREGRKGDESADASPSVIPQPIGSMYPYAVEMSRRVFGALLHHHRDFESWRRDYQDLSPMEQVPVHIDPFFRDLVAASASPVVESDRIFVTGLATGAIATVGARLVFALRDPEEAGGKGISGKRVWGRKYVSTRPHVWPGGADEKVLTKAVPPDVLSADGNLKEARSVFGGKGDRVNDLKSAIEEWKSDGGSFGKLLEALEALETKMEEDLGDLSSKLEAPRPDPKVRTRYDELVYERACLKAELKDLEAASA